MATQIRNSGKPTVLQAVSDFLTATSKFSKTTDIALFFDNFNRINSDSFPTNISVEQKNSSNDSISSLCIDFFENKLITFFQGDRKEVELSKILGVIRDLSEIFSKIHPSAKPLEKGIFLANEETLTQALKLSSTQNLQLTIDGKEAIGVYPSQQRVVLTTNQGQSSTPLQIVSNCAHLFNKNFAYQICPLLGLSPDVISLTKGIHDIYLGRCILGLGKYGSIQNSLGQSELSRIVKLIKFPSFAVYSSPLA